MKVEIPRIERRGPRQVPGRTAGGELMQRELAEQDRAGFAQPCDHRGVARGAVVHAQLGVARRRRARHVEDVLRRIGDAVHRAAPGAARDLGLGGFRLGACRIGGDRDVGVVDAVERRDAREQRLGQLDG